MNVSIQQRGELEIREPLAEAGDYVVLRALKDVVAPFRPARRTSARRTAGNPTDIVIRVYRDAPLPPAPVMDGTAAASDAAVEAAAHAAARPERRADGLRAKRHAYRAG